MTKMNQQKKKKRKRKRNLRKTLSQSDNNKKRELKSHPFIQQLQEKQLSF